MTAGSGSRSKDWYKDAVIYQVHVRAFYDSDADGLGDFTGLMRKLDYLEDLGVTAIWLLPFYPSPLKDDGYDISDYTAVHRSYGTLRDFNRFLGEAHRRGIKVITELVINHTSDQLPWFQKARRASRQSKQHNYYVWSDTTEKYSGVRIIFQDFEMSNWALDPVAGRYYWHRFYSFQPDLNFDSPEVRKKIFGVADFWMNRGVDGLRLDAIPYLYEREGTSCENLPETHAFLRLLRAHIDRNYQDKMLLAEANMWPEDAVSYFGEGDECHMAYNFPVMPRLFMAIRMENRFPIIDIMNQTPSIPPGCQWAMFLRNHDELTLEMVTDRERDYMYQVYARDQEMRINLGIRRRLAPLLGNDRRAIELMNCLLMSLPGTPIIYYGDEIGMGDNIFLGDRNGVRTPMQWSADRNAGFSRAQGQKLYLPVIIDPEYHYETVNVDNQQKNSRSLLWWMKSLVALRKQHPAFGRGSLEFSRSDNTKVISYLRILNDEKILVVANLSRYAQSVSLDLEKYHGMTLVEMFGGNKFPSLAGGECRVTLGPYGFYWFLLEPERAESGTSEYSSVEILEVDGSWENILDGRARVRLESRLPAYLKGKRWFGGKAQSIDRASISEDIYLDVFTAQVHLLFIQVSYIDGTMEVYVLPLAFGTGRKANHIAETAPESILFGLRAGSEEGIVYDAMWDIDFTAGLLANLGSRRKFKGMAGGLKITRTGIFKKILSSVDGTPEPRIPHVEQSNTSVFFDDKLVLKLFRRLQPGINPDLEIGMFLTTRAKFPHAPPVAGALEYVEKDGQVSTVAILDGFVQNEGDAWNHTLDYLGRYYERTVARAEELGRIPVPDRPLLDSLDEQPPDLAREFMGVYMHEARLLGRRTAEFHRALASGTGGGFAPEPYTYFYRQSQYQGMKSLVTQVLRTLGAKLEELPSDIQDQAARILGSGEEIIAQFKLLRDAPISSMRIRTHGDYHLGQVLYTGKDFVIMDFEGEPSRSMSERKTKTSALRDVAGMIRSMHYASFSAEFRISRSPTPLSMKDMEPWRKLWFRWAAISFLDEYLKVSRGGSFIPQDIEQVKLLFFAYSLEKALYEVGYELNNRPDWVAIPFQGISEILNLNDSGSTEV